MWGSCWVMYDCPGVGMGLVYQAGKLKVSISMTWWSSEVITNALLLLYVHVGGKEHSSPQDVGKTPRDHM